MPITMTQLINIVCALIIAALAGIAFYFHHEYRTVSDANLIMQHDVKTMNDNAKTQLKALTAQRDAQQAIINQQAKAQEQKDNDAQVKIKQLATQLHNQPIRVHVVAAVSGSSGSITAGKTSSDTIDRTADQAATDWVLPEVNSERLASAITEIETMSAAYSSCRATLIIGN